MRNILFLVSVLALSFISVCHPAYITIRNKCSHTIWPAAATITGGAAPTKGFELEPQAAKTVYINHPWSGRIWARTHCSKAGKLFLCRSGDCGTGRMECNGKFGKAPATLVDITVAGAGGKDFFDVSLVEGFNLPVYVKPGTGCSSAACSVDINRGCPDTLAIRDRNGGIIGCKSACLAFNQPHYCCTGLYGSPQSCKSSKYSRFFKGQCPQAYSYVFDNPSSTVICPTGVDYHITFCP